MKKITSKSKTFASRFFPWLQTEGIPLFNTLILCFVDFSLFTRWVHSVIQVLSHPQILHSVLFNLVIYTSWHLQLLNMINIVPYELAKFLKP